MRISRNLRSWPFCLWAFLTLLTSCAGPNRISPASPDLVLNKFLSSAMPASYASKLKLHINLRTGEKARTELYLYSRKAREYSFFLKDFWGKDLMRVVIWNDSILVFYPQEMQFIKEPILPFSQSDYWIWSITPLELVQTIDGTLLKNLDEIHFLRENGELYQYKAEQGDMIYSFSLSPKDSGL